MTTTRTAKNLVRGCTILALAASSPLGSTALGADAVGADAAKQLPQTLPSAVAGSFVIHFDRLPAGQRVSEVSFGQGISGFSTGEVPLSALGASRVLVQAQRLDRGGDSNRAMIYNAECAGSAGSCSGNDGDDLFQPGEGNLLIVSQDNDGSDPNDNHDGGSIEFDFSEFGPGAVTVTSLEIIDVSQNGAAAYLYADGELVEEVAIARGDTGELGVVEINTPGVDLMRVTVEDSFAVNDLLFTTP